MGNNPVNRVDPDGGLDDYFFDQDGNLVGFVERDAPDRAFALSDNGIFEFDGDMFSQIPLPESFYDYNINVIQGKAAEDWDYITSEFAEGNIVSRVAEIFQRDFNAADNQETVNDVTIVLGRPRLGRGSNSAVLGAKHVTIGKHKIPREVFHRQIKPNVLSQSGKFQGKVGRNPDINVQGGQIILKGNGPFKGKTFNTGLDPGKFFFKY